MQTSVGFHFVGSLGAEAVDEGRQADHLVRRQGLGNQQVAVGLKRPPLFVAERVGEAGTVHALRCLVGLA